MPIGDPLVELQSPFKGDLLFRSVSVTERLGQPFEFVLEALSPKNSLNPTDVLGKLATVKLETAHGVRYFNGHVVQFDLTGESGRFYHYRLVGRPWLWLLTRTADCRIFQDKKLPDIIKEIFSKYPAAAFEDRLTQTFSQQEYCVQYRETDFNFVSRLMEQEGIYYYFEHHEDRHVLVLADAASAHQSTDGYESIMFEQGAAGIGNAEADVIYSWQYSSEIQPGAYVVTDFDFKRPQAQLKSLTRAPFEHDQAEGEMFDFPGAGLYTQPDAGKRYSRLRLEEMHAQHQQYGGAGNARGLTCGNLFKLAGHFRDDQNAKDLLVVASTIHLEDDRNESNDGKGTSFSCHFKAMASQTAFRTPRLTPKPHVQGPQTAIVVGPSGDEIHTDEHGRVKVHFHWDRYGKKDENDSCWIRVSHPWAGQGWGAVSIPRIGQEVIVDFLEGDPDRPIITGRVYNGESKAPYPLPGGAVVSGIKSNTHKGSGFNEMSMDDTAGKEKITIHGQYDMNTTVEHDQTNTVNNTFTETIKSDAKITITEGTYSHDVATGTAKYHVQAALTEIYDDTQTTTVKNDIVTKSTSGNILIQSDSAHVHIEASTDIKLHVGSSTISMDSAGNITIDGVNVAINGSATVTIKGGSVTSQADSQHQTKGAIVISEGSATNTVKGGMVMLNP